MRDLSRANTYTLVAMERALKDARRRNKMVTPSKRKMEDITTLMRSIRENAMDDLKDTWGDLRIRRTFEVLNAIQPNSIKKEWAIEDEIDYAYDKTKAIIEILQEGAVTDKKSEQKGLVKLLSQRGCEILCMYYGIGGDPMTQEQIAKDLDVARETINRSIKRNLKKIQSYLDIF